MAATKKNDSIALYIGPGAEMAGWIQVVFQETNTPYSLVDPHGIRSGILYEFELLIMPGGYNAAYIPGLRQTGCNAIRSFLEKGKGSYLGICAGSYIVTATELRISRSKMVRKAGIFNTEIEICDLNHPIFKGLNQSSISVYYQNGPHIQPHPDEFPLALYKDGSTSLIEVKTPFHALIFSWHPEKLPHTIPIFLNSIEYLLGVRGI